MTAFPRRTVLIGGLSVLGGGALAYGGSLAVCTGGFRLAGIVAPLRWALPDIADPERVGRAYLAAEGPERIARAVLDRPDLTEMALLLDADARRIRLEARIRQDFAAGETVLAGNWVVARTEALIAAAARI
ncbi:hypothetical protein [Rhodovulum marinum]|uniref:Uncharacterized protein n=1 Tax=Rhodovulum marinum TaxID=320662 RepID=A0A4R2PU68_9RHOB|nr:hypothetical protein [Rhodovulum marinum]TCP39583.1 hypothetical protein EV662_11163 [Rhodovulum marinum]